MSFKRTARRPLTFVVGVDGSQISFKAFHATCRLIDRRKDQLFLYHVTNPDKYEDIPASFQPDTIKEEYEARSVREELLGMQADLRYEFVLDSKESSESKVRSMVLDFAHAKQADVLVLGCFGAKGVRQHEGHSTGSRDKLGCTAMHAIQHANCTCILVKRDTTIPETVEEARKAPLSFMVAVEGSDLAHRGYKTAVALAQDKDSIDVVTLETNHNAASMPACFRMEVIAERYTEENHMYCRNTGKVSPTKRDSRLTIPAQLCEIAAQNDATFLCFGSHGLSGDSSALLGFGGA